MKSSREAVAYLRVSSQGQIGGHGFDRQLEEVQAFCKSAGFALKAVFREEGVSGVLDESQRPAFLEMVESLLGNGCRVVIVEGLDRLARSLAVQEQLVSFLAAKGISLFVARTGEDVSEALSSDPMRGAMVRIQGVFAQLEKELLVKKLAKARAAKKAVSGKCGGRNGLKELNPQALAVIRRLKKAGVKYRAIAEELNQACLFTSMGKPWSAGLVQSAVFRHL
jgi:DNA invertase Pin-like site-specific DNA recombinase